MPGALILFAEDVRSELSGEDDGLSRVRDGQGRLWPAALVGYEMGGLNWIGGVRVAAQGESARELTEGTGAVPSVASPDSPVDLVRTDHRAHRTGIDPCATRLQAGRRLAPCRSAGIFPGSLPLANLVLFLGWGIVVFLLGRVWNQIRGRPSVFLLSFPACLAPLLIFPGPLQDRLPRRCRGLGHLGSPVDLGHSRGSPDS